MAELARGFDAFSSSAPAASPEAVPVPKIVGGEAGRDESGASPERDAAPPVSPRKPKSSWTPGRIALLSVVVLYLGLALLVPLAAMAWKAAEAGVGTVAGALVSPDALDALGRSAVLTVIAVTLNLAFGIAGAIVLVRHRFRGRVLVDALVDLPLAVSPVMVGLAFILLWGRGGWFEPLGVKVAFAFPGLLLATVFVTLPFTLREVAHVLEELGTDEEEVAATLGASAWQTFRMVTLPNVRHGLIFGVTLTTARALAEFGAVLVLGGAVSGKTATATTFIYDAVEERQQAAGYGMALMLAMISLALLLILQRVRPRKERMEV